MEMLQTVIWWYHFLMWSMVYMMLAMSSVCLLIEIQNGVSGVIASLLYPIILMTLVVGWSKIGDYLQESVSAIEQFVICWVLKNGIFLKISDINRILHECNLKEMTAKDKKFILIAMVMNQEPPAFGAPFFDTNTLTFSNVSSNKGFLSAC